MNMKWERVKGWGRMWEPVEFPSGTCLNYISISGSVGAGITLGFSIDKEWAGLFRFSSYTSAMEAANMVVDACTT